MRAVASGLLLVVGLAAGALAGEMIAVPGSKTQFPVQIEATVTGKSVKMVLTGVGMRRRFLVNVYALGSYVQEGVPIKTGDELASSACPRRLELVMERDVNGKEMAEAFQTGVRLNHPEPAFADEMPRLVALMEKVALERHDRVLLTHIPGVGLHCAYGKNDVVIRNERFSNAIWEIYLGKKNLNEDLKKNLLSRLKPGQG